MADLLNLARQQTTTTGPGTVVLGSVVDGFISWSAAGAVNGNTYTYGIEQGDEREIGRGVYNSATQELTRTVLRSTNNDQPINLDGTGTAQVVCTPAAEDFSDLISDHEGAADPHPQYLTEAEGNAAYQPQSSALDTLSTSTSFFLSLSDDVDAAAVRTTLNVDIAGTDNSTNVTLSGTPNYLTIVGQVITRGLINLVSHVTGTLGIGNGGTGGTTAASARTNLNVDVAGTDNSTNVTLAGTPNYITISGQVITRSLVNLVNHITGTLGIGNGGTGATSAAGARTNLGLGTGNNPQFASINLGHETNTTVHQLVGSPGQIAIEGYKVYQRNNILGSVGQSGGVPTGAVIEQGSNVNGEYVRFADGTQICTVSITTDSESGVTWTYPSVFSANPRLAGTIGSTASDASFLIMANGTTTEVIVNAMRYDGIRNPLNRTAFIIAFGRWF